MEAGDGSTAGVSSMRGSVRVPTRPTGGTQLARQLARGSAAITAGAPPRVSTTARVELRPRMASMTAARETTRAAKARPRQHRRSAWRRPTHSPAWPPSRTTTLASCGSMPGTPATPSGTPSAPPTTHMVPSTTQPPSPRWTAGNATRSRSASTPSTTLGARRWA